MILHTTEVIPLPNYQLALRFNNGEQGKVDLTNELTGEIFEPLRDPAQFSTACQQACHANSSVGKWRGFGTRVFVGIDAQTKVFLGGKLSFYLLGCITNECY